MFEFFNKIKQKAVKSKYNSNIELVEKFIQQNNSQKVLMYLNEAEKYAGLPLQYLQLARLCKNYDFNKSVLFFNKYLKDEKDNIEVIIEFAQYLTDNNKINSALDLCQKTLKEVQQHVSILLIMCQNFFKLRDYEKAEEYARKALDLNGNDSYAYKFLCEALFYAGKKEELLLCIEKWEKIIGNSTDLNLAKAYFRILNHNYSLSYDDVRVMVLCNSSNLLHKKINEYKELYNKIFEPQYSEKIIPIVRSRNIKFDNRIYNYYEHLWKGEDLSDKTLFIFDYYCGFGDFIMYSRYIPILEKMAKNLVIEVSENLFELYKYNFPNCKIILSQNKEFKEYDYTFHHDLFLTLQKDFDTFPSSSGYLKVSDDLIKKYSEKIDSSKLKVGIFGSSATTYDNIRSLGFRDVLPVLQNQNCQFYYISKEAPNLDTKSIMNKLNIIDCSPFISDANDTAGIIKNLDLIISVDSFPAHLAGALGVKCFLMLNFRSDWRWFNNDKTTQWYNSVSIFKQKEEGNWENVISSVNERLNMMNCSN